MQQLRSLAIVGGDAPRLIAREQRGRRAKGASGAFCRFPREDTAADYKRDHSG